ncbi:MAG: hypothetical protein AVDCRST_MAG71-2266 [uncultured Lysobacter sp.]|uniref:Translocation and assembly module TamB C-terminal domain-containing protein n=1 Tax=uncultured Lysobacter sp. TaxID=271060 RepID=A0A6J4LTP4_9GAMM|nr:MAG: hypothetical protein AVDCRST_MAG71-2266 [uncultured Lysobacter sp.]
MTLPDAKPVDAAAPTPEEREARIAELRARRHARRRRLAIRTSLGAGLLTLALAAFAWWLLSTIGGRELLLAQIKARLPDNATLTWRAAEGPASGPLTMHDVRFTFDKLTFAARRVTLDPALGPLVGRRLRLDALAIEGATLDLPESEEPFELPRWPEVLPQIAPPLSLQADDIRVDGLVVTRVGAPLIDIRRVRGGLDAQAGALHVERLVIDSDRGRFTAHGDYVPRDNYRTDLTATAAIPAPNARTPLHLGLVARGDLARMDVAVAGAAPGTVNATLVLRAPRSALGADTDSAQWRLRIDADGIDTALLAGAAEPAPAPLSVHLRADGTGGRARLEGSVRQGDFAATLLPSRIALEEQILEFDPLSLRIFDGQVQVRGRGDFGETGDARIRYAVNARGLRWGAQGAAPVTANAQLGVAGTQQAWAVAGRARIDRAGEHATLRLDGRGREQQLAIRTLQVAMPTGTLDAKGEIAWRPQLRWDLSAQLAGFDPGYFLPGWDGAVRGQLASRGQARTGGGQDATFSVRELGGRLRDRPIGGRADLTQRGQQYRGNLALSLGRGRLAADGAFTTTPQLQWNANATLDAFDPGFFVKGWDGAVDARVQSRGRGASTRGGLVATIDVPRIGGQLRGRALAGRAALAVQGAARSTPASYRGDVDMRIGESLIDARGTIGSALDVDVRLQPLQLADLLPDATGTLRGTLQLTGPRTAPSIEADLVGGDLRWGAYRADTLLARGRLPWQARATPGELTLRASGLQLGMPLTSLAVDARGAVEALSLQAQARGDAGALALQGQASKRGATWQGTLASLRLEPSRGAAWSLQQPAQWRWDGRNGALSATCLVAAGGGSLCASADWPRRGLDVNGRGLPLALLQPYLAASTDEPQDERPWLLRGELALDAQLRPAGNAWRGQATITSAGGGLRFGERSRAEILRYENLALRATFDPQRLSAELGAGLFGDGRLDARVATGWDGHAPLAGEVAVNTDELTWLELFSPDIVDPRGRLDGRITLGGTRAQPRIGGQAQLAAFTTELPALGIELREGSARLVAQPDGSARIDGRVRSGDGVLTVDGSLAWRPGAAPLVLNVRGDNVLVADTRELMAVVDPDVQIRVAAGVPTTVTGRVTVPTAQINLERLDQGAKVSPDVVVLDPVDPKAKVDTPVALDLALVLGEDVALSGFGLTGGLDGQLQVRSVPGGDMTARGQLEVDGRYTAYGQRLTITRGRLVWSGGAVGDPVLDIRAEREVGDITAGIDVRGRASAPTASVWSSTGASQSEALSYLALGRPLSSVGGAEGQQLNAADAALSAGGSLLASQLGARIGLDDAGVLESRTLGGSVFGIGKYLSPRLYVGYGVSLLGTGQVLTLKYLLRRGFALEIESSSVENRASVNYRHER